MLLTRLLNPAVTTGALSLIDADGRVHQIGRGTPTIAVRLHDKALHRELAFNPRLRFGEA